MQPDMWDVRRGAKLLSDQVMASKMAEFYRDNEVNSLDDVEEDALIADQVREELFGNNYPDYVAEELDNLIMMLSRPGGMVQEELGNHGGTPMTLCSADVTRKLTDGSGTEYIIRKKARFATTNPDLAAAYYLGPQFNALDRSIERLANRTAEHTRRLPGLTQHTPAMITRTHQVLGHELPEPKPKKTLKP